MGDKWPMRVLLVEDESVNRLLLSKILSRFVTEVREAVDGTDALRILGEFKPDLLITDLSMPKMDGIALITEIRKTQNALRIVVLSAHNEQGILDKAEALKTSRFLFKPVRVDLLSQALDEVGSELGLTKS